MLWEMYVLRQLKVLKPPIVKFAELYFAYRQE
jgi:hypothetical protein